jgi:eukaryotic-like serine/threonine-protein kinase
MPAAGGSAVQVSRGGGVCAEESDDGQYVCYSKAKCSSGIWRMPLSGGDESEVLKEPVGWGNWALGRRGVLYVTCRAQGSRQECTIQFLDSATGRTKPLFRTADFDHVWNPATSPDEKWILFSASPPLHSELMLMENFR